MSLRRLFGIPILAPILPEWLNQDTLTRHNWKPWKDALIEAHSPKSETQLSPNSTARSRLAYDELLANQLALGLIRNRQKKHLGKVIKPYNKLRNRAINTLPYDLTSGQIAVIREIDNDLASEDKMLRLLQGDVGVEKQSSPF